MKSVTMMIVRLNRTFKKDTTMTTIQNIANELSKKCDLTGKKFLNGNNVSHSNNRTKRKFIPNLQSISFFSNKLNNFRTF